MFISNIAVFTKNVYDSIPQLGLVILIMELFFLVLQIGVTLQVFYTFNMSYLIIPMISAMFFFIGSAMKKIKRNFFMGIRTPWTLSSDSVWKKTHELGSKVFIMLGFVMLVTLVLPPEVFVWILMGFVLLMVGTLFIYSYLEYKKENRKTRHMKIKGR